jgi:hypothetical protein
MRILLLVGGFDFSPSSQCILVSVIPSCFRFVNMCLRQTSLLSRCKPRYFTSSSWGRCTLFRWTGGQGSARVVNVIYTDQDLLAFILYTFNHFCISSSLVCIFCESMPVSLSVASTALSSANFAVANSVEVDRSAMYSRYSWPQDAGWGTSALTKDSSVSSVSTIRRKCLLCR